MDIYKYIEVDERVGLDQLIDCRDPSAKLWILCCSVGTVWPRELDRTCPCLLPFSFSACGARVLCWEGRSLSTYNNFPYTSAMCRGKVHVRTFPCVRVFAMFDVPTPTAIMRVGKERQHVVPSCRGPPSRETLDLTFKNEYENLIF